MPKNDNRSLDQYTVRGIELKRLNLFACASALLLILACASAAEEGAAQPEDESEARNQAEGDSETKRQTEGFDNVSADDLPPAFLEQLVQKNGTAAIWNLLGEAYYDQARYSEAYEAFQTALEIDPKYTRAAANMEMVKRELSQFGAEDFDDASAADLKQMAEQARRQREYSKAAALLEMAVQKSGTAEMWNLLGEAYYELERYSEASEAFQTALEIDPKYTRAAANMEVVKWKLSLPGAKGFDNVSADELKQMALQAQRLGEYGKAAALLEQAVQKDGTAEMWNLLGEAYYELGWYSASHFAFGTVLEMDPKYTHAAANMEKVKKALSQLGVAGAEDASTDDLKQMALQAQRWGGYRIAAALLGAAVRKSGTAEIWNLLGEAYYELERYLESYKAFETALEMDLKYTRAAANMERVKREMARLGAEGASADNLKQAAQYERRLGEYGKAAALLERAVQKNGTAEMWNLLGEAYYELERYLESYEAFQTALEIDPKYTPAAANMEVVKWALPQPGFEDSMPQRFSTPKTVRTQILSSYFTGTAMGGWLLFVSSVVGYEVDDRLTIIASGFVLSSMMRVPEVGKLVSFGHGASRSAFAGAVLPPLIGALVVRLSNENPTRRDLINGARIGAIFSPLFSTLGYHLSTSRLLKHPRSIVQHTPFERTETQLSMQFAQFSF